MSMVVGEGVIANRFLDYSFQTAYQIYGGYLSDSTVNHVEDYKKEEQLVREALGKHNQSTFIYFSSCNVLDPNEGNSLFVQHHLRVEKTIESSGKPFLIFRLPEVLGFGPGNSSILRFFVDSIINEKPIQIWKNSKKNFIDIDDVYSIVQEVLRQNQFLNRTLNIASPYQTSMNELAITIGDYFGKPGQFEIIEKGSSFDIKIDEIKSVISQLKINFELNYLKRGLEKYFRNLVKPPYLMSVIVPTYNEEHGIEEFYRRTKNVLNILQGRFDHEIIFVNDFSRDNTLAKLHALATRDSRVKVINFSRNFGNQMGITAGIDHSKGDIAVIIDDDLQDPPEVILNFLAKWSEGFKVVYGVRPKRQGVNFFFKLLAMIYYRIIGGLSEIKIPKDTGDFRLIDRIVIESLRGMKEENRYYRGMVAWVGFPQVGCLYERDKRYAGTSTFSFKKYINFALNGLTSFTDKPLYFSSLLGFIVTSFGFCFAVSIMFKRIFDPSSTIQGWTSLMAVVIFFGGVQLLSIGVVGIYLSKIFREVKGRPLYIVESTTNFEK